jgi:hypothetical protein
MKRESVMSTGLGCPSEICAGGLRRKRPKPGRTSRRMDRYLREVKRAVDPAFRYGSSFELPRHSKAKTCSRIFSGSLGYHSETPKLSVGMNGVGSCNCGLRKASGPAGEVAWWCLGPSSSVQAMRDTWALLESNESGREK